MSISIDFVAYFMKISSSWGGMGSRGSVKSWKVIDEVHHSYSDLTHISCRTCEKEKVKYEYINYGAGNI